MNTSNVREATPEGVSRIPSRLTDPWLPENPYVSTKLPCSLKCRCTHFGTTSCCLFSIFPSSLYDRIISVYARNIQARHALSDRTFKLSTARKRVEWGKDV